jgi:hypothetical protein
MTGKKRMVDLAAVRRGLAGLDATVRRWPELTTPEARERLGAYLERDHDMGRTKNAKDKGPTVQTAVRLDLELITRLDAIARKLSRPGLEVTRTDALRICLLTGLQAIEKER